MEVIICGTCKGTGKVEHWESGHNPDKIISECPICKGTGRLLEDTYRVQVPFGTDIMKSGYYQVNSDIYDLIRKYEKKVNNK